MRDTFNAKEKKHMVDVRQLWQNARLVMIVSWFVCLISAGWLFWKFGSNGTRCLGILMTGIRQAGACLLVVLIFLPSGISSTSPAYGPGFIPSSLRETWTGCSIRRQIS
ncbi:DUF1461 domain-containing protein [Allobaculum sp. Allo2]|uniref:lipoprotein intramolecular transacylase Lit n=1 Tax=Allobaculum sp. Allo2 TaxID=2853432 RepID=UPI001F61ED11|nr:DUF1461 domain-containing protein [Allobaculum sp. Allo2]UNT92839.1 DUF1461 domain-containing protein [Allobaculum sp. Allo2]